MRIIGNQSIQCIVVGWDWEGHLIYRPCLSPPPAPPLSLIPLCLCPRNSEPTWGLIQTLCYQTLALGPDRWYAERERERERGGRREKTGVKRRWNQLEKEREVDRVIPERGRKGGWRWVRRFQETVSKRGGRKDWRKTVQHSPACWGIQYKE